jgi:hypothetical protein
MGNIITTVPKKTILYYQKSIWGNQIFYELLKNGSTSKKKLQELISPETKQKITGKILWETINR